MIRSFFFNFCTSVWFPDGWEQLQAGRWECSHGGNSAARPSSSWGCGPVLSHVARDGGGGLLRAGAPSSPGDLARVSG